MAETSRSLPPAQDTSTTGTKFDSVASWLALHGNAEYALYKRGVATPCLSYEDWASSEHVLGPYLYHLTLEAWDEADSSENEEASRDSPDTVPHIPLESQKTKSMTTNGTGMHKNALTSEKSSKPDVTQNEPAVSTKKRRGRKKKNTSGLPPENSVASSSAVVARTPATPSASPEESDASSAPRRGLRVRTPAQQRPYYHHAQIWDNDSTEDGHGKKRSPMAKPSRLSHVTLADDVEAEEDEGDRHMYDDEHTAENTDERQKEQFPIEGESRNKGKGRRWKRNEDEEDSDYVHAMQKTQSSKAPTRRGQPRKSSRRSFADLNDDDDNITMDDVEDNDELTVDVKISDKKNLTPKEKPKNDTTKITLKINNHAKSREPSGRLGQKKSSPKKKPKKPRKSVDSEVVIQEAEQKNSTGSQGDKVARRKRRSYKSEEFVQDDDDDLETAVCNHGARLQNQQEERDDQQRITDQEEQHEDQEEEQHSKGDEEERLKQVEKPKLTRRRRTYKSEEFVQDEDSETSRGSDRNSIHEDQSKQQAELKQDEMPDLKTPKPVRKTTLIGSEHVCTPEITGDEKEMNGDADGIGVMPTGSLMQKAIIRQE